MDPVRSQDTPEGKGPLLRYRSHSDESLNMHQTDNAVTDDQDDKRPIRRVRSPSRPRAWLSNTHKPKFTGHFYKPHLSRDDRPFYKAGAGSRKYYHPFNHRQNFQKRNRFQPKLHHNTLRQRDLEREKEWYEPRKGADADSPPNQTSASRPFPSRSTSSRDKDMPFTAGQSDRNQSRERDHRGSKSKDRERSRDGELPSTVSQTAARDRAIQQKRREIDEVYYQECEMFGLVTKMLIEKDPSLEQPIQSSLQENLRDIGKRCVEAMQKFIDDYDAKELLH